MKINDKRIATIKRELRSGAPRKVAAETAGITEQTFYDWLQRKGAPYERFRKAVTDAENYIQVRIVKAIIVAAENGNWRAGAWILEKRYPEHWGDLKEAASADEDEAAPKNPLERFDELAASRATRGPA